MSRVRSPNYPVIGLEGAIVKAEQVYGSIHTTPADREEVAVALGYSGLNGASARVTSALIQYDLLEKTGTNYKISDLAMKIIFPENSRERVEAIREAALAPKIFAETFDHFQNRIPSDRNLEIYFSRKGFAKSAVGKAIEAYKETLKLLSDLSDEYISDDGQDVDMPLSTSRKSSSDKQRKEMGTSKIDPTNQERVFLDAQIGTDSRCKILVAGEIGVSEIDMMIDLLSLNKKILSSQQEFARVSDQSHRESIREDI